MPHLLLSIRQLSNPKDYVIDFLYDIVRAPFTNFVIYGSDFCTGVVIITGFLAGISSLLSSHVITRLRSVDSDLNVSVDSFVDVVHSQAKILDVPSSNNPSFSGLLPNYK